MKRNKKSVKTTAYVTGLLVNLHLLNVFLKKTSCLLVVAVFHFFDSVSLSQGSCGYTCSSTTTTTRASESRVHVKRIEC